MSVHDFERNKWRYLELVDYFEQLASGNAHIGHDPVAHKAFVRTDIMDIGRAKVTGLMSPYLAIEDPSARPLNDNMENIQLLWSTAIVVGIEVRQGDEPAEREAMDRAVRILVSIMARMKEDRKRMRILDFEFPSVRINKVREHFRNTVGYRMAFDFPTQMDLSVTIQDWPDYDFSQDLPAFARVIDQGQEIRLGVNGLYTCPVLVDATVRLLNTDAEEIDSFTVGNGANVPRTVAGGVARVVNTLGTMVREFDVKAGGDVTQDTLPDVVHTDSDLQAVVLPAGVGMVCTAPPGPIRNAYDAPSYTFWVGYGSDTDTDQDNITIKRGVTDPVTGLVTEATAFGPWEDYLTLPYV